MGKVRTTILATIILIAGMTAFAVMDLTRYAQTPGGDDTTEKLLVIHPGQGFNASLTALSNAGIITHPLKFKIVARYKGYDKRVKAGEYKLSLSMPPLAIMVEMTKGKDRLYRLTIPEGYNLKEIAKLVEKAGFCTGEAFLEKAMDPEFARESGIAGETFEGYLFPETYLFPRKVSPERIIETLLGEFRNHFQEEWKKRASNLGFSIHQVVTLASIIEKETGTAVERPIISSVFHNRLKKGMRLETDPTVIYGIKNFDGNITRKHLRTRTPYNTYMIRGLPPGPIANPGAAALEAALYPDNTKYIFFVSKGDTTHKFSTNLRAHNRAVRKYQLRRK